MASALVLNASNAIQNTSNGTYSTFQYQFPGNTSLENKQLLLSSLIYPYSNYNFRTSPYQNTNFQITWINGTGANIVLPDGYYGAADLNNYLDEQMINLGWYTINGATGTAQTNNYYLSIQENETYYGIQLNSFPVPTSTGAAAAGITQPQPPTWSYPTQPTNPQFTILPPVPNPYGTSFSASIGFNPQTWPATGTPGSNQSILSNFTPQINPVSSVLVLCSLANNTFASQNQVIYAFGTGDTLFGAYHQIYPPQEIWLNCSRGNFSNFTITFVDQTGRNPVPLQDPTVTCVLSLRDTPLADRGVKLAQGR